MKPASVFLQVVGSALLLACGNVAWTDPEQAGPDFAVQGEYVFRGGAAQVIALGDGAFRLAYLKGGLPGAGWDGQPGTAISGQRKDEAVRFEDGSTIVDGTLRTGAGAVLRKVERGSPTMGAPPPPGAKTAFDEEPDDDGRLPAGVTSMDRFLDAKVHVEFRTPFMPGAGGQARGNSGVYLQNRYEVQILDSFGLSGEWNECGGIYKVRKPSVNMALPPLSWQTYDIDFQAARFDGGGRKISPATITVLHNGVAIHEDVEIPESTGGGDDESPEPGPLHLQDHGDPVFFRNVWVLPVGS